MPKIDPLVAEAMARAIESNPQALKTALRAQLKAASVLDTLKVEFEVNDWPPKLQSILLRQVAHEAMNRAMRADDAAKA